MRWQHPSRGAVPPGTFVALAEESGMIGELDRWVVRSAFEQIATWQRVGIRVTISINLSVNTLGDALFLNHIDEQRRLFAVPSDLVIFEITESAAMLNSGATIRMLNELRSRGFHLAIDDFGTGNTSLAYLKNLPVDIVKIDKSFVDGIGVNHKDEGVLRAVLTLAKGLDLIVVAEGVETAPQCAWLTEQGCDYAQGWHTGRPGPAATITPLLS